MAHAHLLLLAVSLVAVHAGCGKPIGGGSEGTGTGAGGSAASSKDATGTLLLVDADAGPAGAPVAKLDLDECWSGQMLDFRGVELFHDPDTARRVRLVEDPVVGPRVVLVGIRPGKPRVVIDAAACTRFEANLESSNDTLNGVRSVHGSLKLTCEIPGAGTVTLDSTFKDCSFDNRAMRL